MFEFEDDIYTGVASPDGETPPENELDADKFTSLVLSGSWR